MNITDSDRQKASRVLKQGGKSAFGVRPEWISERCEWTVEFAAAVLSELRTAEPEQQGPSETREFDGDLQVFTGYSKDRITSLDQLIKFCDVDGSEWEVERYVVNKWEVGAKDKAQEIKVTPLFQVKAWFKRRVKIIAAREEIDAMLAEITSKAPIYPKIKRAAAPTGNMLELSFPDLHIGKLAWGQETGWEDYDSNYAEQVFRDSFSSILQRASAYKYDKVCLVVGNDLLNADNRENTTTRGTPQSCDTRHQKSFQIARRVNTWAIEQAREIAPVDVVMIPGNHDTNTVFYLGEVLDALFKNVDGVTVDNRPTLRKVYSFGLVSIMFAHGDKGKRKDYPLLMATEARKVWGDAKYCEIHTGDKHQVRLEEQMGVRVRILPSLCPPDAWHAGEGYVGNIRSAEAYMWNAQEGLIGTAYYNVMAGKK